MTLQVVQIELIVFALSYTSFMMSLVAAIFVLSVLRRARLRRTVLRPVSMLREARYPLPEPESTRPELPLVESAMSAVVLDRERSAPGVTRIVLQTGRDTTS